MTPEDIVITPRGLRYMGQFFPCSVGRGGIVADKTEGDGATPRGRHHVTGCLYRPDRVMRPNIWASPIYPGDLWSDDTDHADYNQLVHAPYKHSHENLRRPDPLYDIVLLMDWNWPDPVPGKGSAIFIHRWRKPGHPTEGCVALHPLHLRYVAAKIVPGTSVIIG